MSNDQDNARQLKLFSTAPHPCSYLDDEEASTLFIDPDAKINQTIYTYLSERGFRRSGQFLYKPDCPNCQACISIRIPVNRYNFSRNDKRLLKKNAELEVIQVADIATDEYYNLYADYITTRHHDGDMFPPSQEQYQNFLTNAFETTQYFVFTLHGKPKAIAVVDRFINAISSVYTFFDPHDEKRSLGSFAILWQIQKAKELNLDYVYLGYWVKDCQKMRYKTRFRPSEVFINQRWIALT